MNPMQLEQDVAGGEELSTMALLLAHDLRSVLAVLHSLTILMEHKPEARHLARMKQQLQVCDQLVEHFVQFAEGKATPKQVSLAGLVSNATEAVHLPPNISVEMDVSFEGEVYVDPQQVLHVLLNLMNNAGKACGEAPSTIRIAVRREDGYGRVDVQDNGRGVPQDFQPDLMDKRMPERDGGLGWGLALCRKIIYDAGGRMAFSSQPGQGATFSFWLPLTSH